MRSISIHPGEYIRDELEARSWTQGDLAEIIGRSAKSISQIVSGRSGITSRTAKELALAFGTSAEVWLNLQTRYDLSREEATSGEIEKKAAIFSLYPVREMKNRGWIGDWESADDLESNLCAFFEVDKLDDVELRFAAKTSSTIEEYNPAHVAWVKKAILMSEACAADKFTVTVAKKHLDELLALTSHPREIRKVPFVLGKMGIRFVVLKHLTGTKIDGAAIWLDNRKTKPLIALSLRFDRIDNFWHALLHEVSHVLNKDDTTVDADLSEAKPDIEKEKRANREASEMLIPNEILDSFIGRNGPRFFRTQVIQFANLHAVHPGIVVGQLHYRQALDYKFLRKLLVPMRSELVEYAIADGWDD